MTDPLPGLSPTTLPGSRFGCLRIREQGFTLIEVLVVASIMALAMAIMVPRFTGILDNVRLKAVTDRIAGETAYARSYAMANHDTTWVVFDETNNDYGLYVGPSAGSRSLIPDPHSGKTALVDVDGEYNGITLTVDFGGANEVSFDWWGRPSSGGSISIDSGSRSLTLVAETGVVYE